MADHMHDALGKMLDQYDERQRGDLARVQQAKDEDAAFLARFDELRRDVVRPVFESAGALLAARGHEFRIYEEEFSADRGGKVAEAGISIQFLPAGMQSQAHADDHARSLSITTRHYNKTVWINAGVAMNAGGIAGSKGAYPLEKISRQLIEEELVRFVGTIVAA